MNVYSVWVRLASSWHRCWWFSRCHSHNHFLLIQGMDRQVHRWTFFDLRLPSGACLATLGYHRTCFLYSLSLTPNKNIRWKNPHRWSCLGDSGISHTKKFENKSISVLQATHCQKSATKLLNVSDDKMSGIMHHSVLRGLSQRDLSSV